MQGSQRRQLCNRWVAGTLTIKRQFGFTKVRYRGLAENTAQLVTLFALSNLWLARRALAGTG